MPAGVCGSASAAPPRGSFQGDSSYTWTIAFPDTSTPRNCVAFRVAWPDSAAAPPADFWLASVNVEDSAGEVDELEIRGGATLLGGTGITQNILPKGGFIELGRAMRGSLYWYGYKLLPPYIFETTPDYSGLWIRVDHVPEFHALGIVRVPTYVPTEQQVAISEGSRALLPQARRKMAIDSLAMAAYRVVISRGGTHLEAMSGAIASYHRHSDMVDSARAISSRSFVVHWRGDREPSHHSLRHPGDRRPAPGEILKQGVRERIDALESGSLCLIREDGLETIMPPRDSPAIEAEITALQAGSLTTPGHEFLSDLADAFRRPRTPIQELLSRVR